MTLIIALFACATSTPALADSKAEVGQPAPDFELQTLDGKAVKLSDYKGKTVVLEWFNPGCPYVKQAHGPAGSLETMAAETTKNPEVVWLAVNSGAPGKQGHGVEANKAAKGQWKMTHPVLVDEAGDVGRMYGAKTTPHMYVVDPAGTLRYNGAIDNAPLGKATGTPVNYVNNALTQLAAGATVEPPRTKPYGCSVKY